jgi:hypothetical protein
VWRHQPEHKKGDSMKSSGRSLTLAAIEKRPCRRAREQAELGGFETFADTR